MSTRYSKVNRGSLVRSETLRSEKDGEESDDVNNMSDMERLRIPKDTKLLKNFLTKSRKVNSNGLRIPIQESFDFASSRQSIVSSMAISKNICLIEESPFYIHKVSPCLFSKQFF
jgi:hypothetical protein